MVDRRKYTFGNSSAALGCIALFLVGISLFPAYTISAMGEAAPFSFGITPNTVTAKPGDTVSFQASIEASSEFSDPIEFTLAISALAYNTTFTLGNVSPPYPKTYDFSVQIPSEIPVSITVQGVVTGTSGSFSQTETVQINIQQSSGGDFFSSLIKIFSDFWNWLMSLLGR